MQAKRIAWTTGEATLNRTKTNGAVGGTDLGILWAAGNGDILSIFGDTYSDNISGIGTGADWRYNVLARSNNLDYQTRGLIIKSWVTDRANHAKQIITTGTGSGDQTCIPTSGIAIRGRQYVSYMNIRAFQQAGAWTTSYAGIAYSDDYGTTWTKDTNARYYNFSDYSQNFQMVAFARPGDGYLYLYGTPNGRFGAARVARVPEDKVLDLSQHRQWDGAAWVNDQARAINVIPGPVGELSIAYHEASHQWLAAYYHSTLAAIVVLTAPTVIGPWSAPNIVATQQDYPQLYGFFFHPWSMYDINPCASMSQWPPYETQLMQLTEVPGTTSAPATASSLFNSAQGYTNVFNSVSNPNWCGSNNIFPVQLTDGRKVWISGLSYSGNLTTGRIRPTNYQNVMNTVLEESQQMITAWAPSFFDSVGRAHFFDSRQIKDIAGGVARLDPVSGISLKESLYLSVSWTKVNWTAPYLYDTGEKIKGSSMMLLEIPLETLKSGLSRIRKSVVMPSTPILGAGTLNYGAGFYVFDKTYLHIVGRSALTAGKWNLYLARVPLTYMQDVSYIPAAMEYFSFADGSGYTWSPDIAKSTPILSEVGPNVDIRYDVSRKFAYLNKNPLTGTVDFRAQQSIARGTIDSTSSKSLFTVPIDQGAAANGFISPSVYDVPWAKLSSGNRLGAYTVQQFNQTFDQTTPSFSRPHFFEYDAFIGTPSTPTYTAPPAAPIVVVPPPVYVPPPVVIPPAPTGTVVYMGGDETHTDGLTYGTKTRTSGEFPVIAGEVLVCTVGCGDVSMAILSVISYEYQNGKTYTSDITWTKQVSAGRTGTSPVALFTGTVKRSMSLYMAVSFQNSNSSSTVGYTVQRFSNARITNNTVEAVGVSSAQASFTTQNPKATIAYIVADYNGRPGAGTPVGGGIQSHFTLYEPYLANHYCYHATTAVGTRAIGMSAPIGELATIAAIELAPIA